MSLDEIGTIPKIESAEMMFSASRSRNISIVAIIQSLAQLEKNYGKEGASIIVDNCQDTLFGGFAPNSETAKVMSENLGSKTVMSGSVSKGKNDPSQSLQMIERPLMTTDELKSMPKGHFILMKTGMHPMKTVLRLFIKWKIKLDKEYQVNQRVQREVKYADINKITSILKYKFEKDDNIKFDLKKMRRVSKLNKDYMYFYTKVSSANVTPAGRMVYRALLRYANRKTWSCFPSVKTIVNDTGLSERTVRKQIKILVEEELIIKIPRKRENNGNTSNMYFFN